MPFQAAHRPRSHKSVTRYSLFGNLSRAKTYPGILNISLSISIAHQLIDILKFNVCHFHYNSVCIKKLLNKIFCFKWDSNLHLQCEQLLYYHLYKTQNHFIKSITGIEQTKETKKLKKRRIRIIKVPKQDEDTGTCNLQILLHLRSLF